MESSFFDSLHVIQRRSDATYLNARDAREYGLNVLILLGTLQARASPGGCRTFGAAPDRRVTLQAANCEQAQKQFYTHALFVQQTSPILVQTLLVPGETVTL
jgi:hypothetical protein